MFKYGISYYTVENGERKPESGVDVRLLRPGADWQTGIPLIETGDTGYYECFIEDEKDCCRRNLKVHQKRNYRLHHSED
jgi:hypothetical protein